MLYEFLIQLHEDSVYVDTTMSVIVICIGV